MNVSCTHCKKAYVLPASAAAPGLKLRVRCKACGQIFEVSTEPVEAPKNEVIAQVKTQAEASLQSLPEGPQSAPSNPNAIGEVTRHFINQSGANRRNPPWKIALFLVGIIGIPFGVLYLLSEYKIVGVTVVNEQGEEVKQSFFTSEGMSGIGDVLSGRAAEKRAEAKAKAEVLKRAVVARPKIAGSNAPLNDLTASERRGAGPGTTETMGNVTGSLGAFYNDTEKKDRGPKVRAEDDARSKSHAGGLDEKEAAKVVSNSQGAFQGCIEEALRRNPNLKVGKVAISVTVAPSGTVKAANIEPKTHENSEWGACLMQRAKRMVFPPFDGDEEAEVQVPLVVGVSL
jgi:hypothetical protein